MRPANPWVWRRALRDHGPNSQGFLLAMLMLSTYMDGQGFAYPAQRTWARDARMARNTLAKHITTASALGWLGIEEHPGGGQGWKQHLYRAALPDNVALDEKAEMIVDHIQAEVGEVETEAGSPMLSHVIPQAGSSLREPRRGTPGDTGREAGSNGHSNVAQSAIERGSNGSEAGSTRVSLKSLTQRTLKRSSHQEEAHAGACAFAINGVSEKAKTEDPEARERERDNTIVDLLSKGYTWADILTFTKSYGTTRNDVVRCETAWKRTQSEWDQT